MKLEIIKPYLGCSVGTIIDTSMESLHLDPEDLISSGYARQADPKEPRTLLPEEVGKEMGRPRKGRPRETFCIIGHSNSVTMSTKRKADRIWNVASVWYLESRAEVNLLIRELEKARDYAFTEKESNG